MRERLERVKGRLLREAVEAARLLIEALEREGIRVEEAYLFGSRVRGDALEHSDADLVIVSGAFRGMGYLERLDLIYRIEARLRTHPFVEVIPLTREELEERLREPTMLRDAARYWLRLRP